MGCALAGRRSPSSGAPKRITTTQWTTSSGTSQQFATHPIAVLETSPICYLVLIGEIDILPKRYSQVLVPAAVIAELLHDDAPEPVRTWAANLPSWISAQQNPSGAITGMEKLQAGILLAESIPADMILLDEKSARRVAADRGLRITGTLGVLEPQRDGWLT